MDPKGVVMPERRYGRLLVTAILSIILVSVIPLLIVVWIKHYAY